MSSNHQVITRLFMSQWYFWTIATTLGACLSTLFGATPLLAATEKITLLRDYMVHDQLKRNYFYYLPLTMAGKHYTEVATGYRLARRRRPCQASSEDVWHDPESATRGIRGRLSKWRKRHIWAHPDLERLGLLWSGCQEKF